MNERSEPARHFRLRVHAIVELNRCAVEFSQLSESLDSNGELRVFMRCAFWLLR